MNPIKNTVISILLGGGFAYLSIFLAGIGAAIAIPDPMLDPLVFTSPTLGFAIVNLLTIGVPLLAAYMAISYFSRLVFKHVSYILLATPFLLLNLYLYSVMPPHKEMLFSVITSLPSVLVVAACALVLTKTVQHK